MAQITLEAGDAAELAEMLTFLASWLSSNQKRTSTKASLPSSATRPTPPRPSAPTCTGSPSLLGASDGEELFGEPTP